MDFADSEACPTKTLAAKPEPPKLQQIDEDEEATGSNWVDRIEIGRPVHLLHTH